MRAVVRSETLRHPGIQRAAVAGELHAHASGECDPVGKLARDTAFTTGISASSARSIIRGWTLVVFAIY
ncbi:hypothetical protein [Bradyrhizobium elkanii]|uniref:hypothetical protein n=1 Tax=Bradyrhizobium elkanii TaxID=29448 RepID=UPI000841E390|nr:hypothetical protein [Bradyrhizobium elkanii]ODM76602.1 hypothetical protein A6X20_30065 [Bradyrhizobium elkanii]ODM78694.1 hypothetical protein A6452_30635 [Bradyrhizobium elkanii]